MKQNITKSELLDIMLAVAAARKIVEDAYEEGSRPDIEVSEFRVIEPDFDVFWEPTQCK